MKRHRTLLATILIVGAVLTPVILYYVNYYDTSFNSVNGTTLSVVSVKRYINYTTFLNVTFYLEASVATQGSLDTFVQFPVFHLIGGADSRVGFIGSGVVKDSVIITRTQSAIFSLTFRATDDTLTHYIAGTNPNYLNLSLYSVENAGMYQEVVTKTDSGNWTFSGNSPQGTRTL